ncbi:hypothetical protein PR048_007550 [Dryococelus australis]|uniref:Uncharacterized protein n=1 Tax=Dryococelus australis TaxID=614101 RepID=A0ABQ9HUK6_9NEOP|nr:hypothetical protein PR048_007550 [Dryococelus australis]
MMWSFKFVVKELDQNRRLSTLTGTLRRLDVAEPTRGQIDLRRGSVTCCWSALLPLPHPAQVNRGLYEGQASNAIYKGEPHQIEYLGLSSKECSGHCPNLLCQTASIGTVESEMNMLERPPKTLQRSRSSVLRYTFYLTAWHPNISANSRTNETSLPGSLCANQTKPGIMFEAHKLVKSEEIWAALNIEVLRADESERSPRKPADQTPFPTRENPGATPPGIEPGSPSIHAAISNVRCGTFAAAEKWESHLASSTEYPELTGGSYTMGSQRLKECREVNKPMSVASITRFTVKCRVMVDDVELSVCVCPRHRDTSNGPCGTGAGLSILPSTRLFSINALDCARTWFWGIPGNQKHSPPHSPPPPPPRALSHSTLLSHSKHTLAVMRAGRLVCIYAPPIPRTGLAAERISYMARTIARPSPSRGITSGRREAAFHLVLTAAETTDEDERSLGKSRRRNMAAVDNELVTLLLHAEDAGGKYIFTFFDLIAGPYFPRCRLNVPPGFTTECGILLMAFLLVCYSSTLPAPSGMQPEKEPLFTQLTSFTGVFRAHATMYSPCRRRVITRWSWTTVSRAARLLQKEFLTSHTSTHLNPDALSPLDGFDYCRPTCLPTNHRRSIPKDDVESGNLGPSLLNTAAVHRRTTSALCQKLQCAAHFDSLQQVSRMKMRRVCAEVYIGMGAGECVEGDHKCIETFSSLYLGGVAVDVADRELASHRYEPGSIPGKSRSPAASFRRCSTLTSLHPLRLSRPSYLICTVQRHDGNTARLARRSDEALGVRFFSKLPYSKCYVKLRPEGSAGFLLRLRANRLRLLGNKIMQGDMHRGKEGLGSPAL